MCGHADTNYDRRISSCRTQVCRTICPSRSASIILLCCLLFVPSDLTAAVVVEGAMHKGG